MQDRMQEFVIYELARLARLQEIVSDLPSWEVLIRIRFDPLDETGISLLADFAHAREK